MTISKLLHNKIWIWENFRIRIVKKGPEPNWFRIRATQWGRWGGGGEDAHKQGSDLGSNPPGPLDVLADPPLLAGPRLVVLLPDHGDYRLFRQVLLLLLEIMQDKEKCNAANLWACAHMKQKTRQTWNTITSVANPGSGAFFPCIRNPGYGAWKKSGSGNRNEHSRAS